MELLDEWRPLAEAAKVLKVLPIDIWWAGRKGQLETRKIGKQWFVKMGREAEVAAARAEYTHG